MATIEFGKYQITRELGRGAMGVVYEAQDPDLGCELALKVITLKSGASPESRQRQVERFSREARALSQINHPHVVRLIERGEIGGQAFFTMELVRGTTLRDRLQFEGSLSLTELLRLTLEMCGVLDHLHQQGVVHRDVKPDNIMLMPDGSAKLMDFGIAMLLFEDNQSTTGGFEGSPAYMSPEQVAGRPVDGRTDIYSLAVTVYEAATGKRAFDGDSIATITQKVVKEYPAPPAGLPLHFQAILMRAMAKNPSHRYARASELAADLRAGRMPYVPRTPAVVPPPPPSGLPVYLGGDPPAAPRAYAPSDPQSTLLETPAAPPAPAYLPDGRPACRQHAGRAASLQCGSCKQPICYTCMLEIPNRGIVCRSCAFGTRPTTT